MSVWEDLTVCDFLDIIDSWKLVGWGKMGFKAQTCWTDLLAFWGVWNRSRILNFGPDRLFFRFSRALFPMHVHGKKCWEFQMTSLEPLGQCCSNFIWSLPGAGESKIAKIVAVHWPKWPPCPYMVKTFKNLLLQNRGCLVPESLHKSSGTGGLPKLTYLWRGQVCFWAPYICMEKMLIISNDLLWSLQGQCSSNFMLSLLGAGERKIAKMGVVHWSKWLLCPYMVKKI